MKVLTDIIVAKVEFKMELLKSFPFVKTKPLNRIKQMFYKA